MNTKIFLVILLLSFAAFAEEEPESEDPDTCKEAASELAAKITTLAADKPKIVLVGEAHSTLSTEKRKAIISRLVPDSSGVCIAWELPPEKEDHLQAVFLDLEIAKPLGLKSIYIDSAVLGMTEDEAYTLRGLNKRDLAMEKNINAKLATCTRIISMNGSLHVTHDHDAEFNSAGSSRRNLADLLGSEAKSLDTYPMAKACNLATATP